MVIASYINFTLELRAKRHPRSEIRARPYLKLDKMLPDAVVMVSGSVRKLWVLSTFSTDLKLMFVERNSGIFRDLCEIRGVLKQLKLSVLYLTVSF